MEVFLDYGRSFGLFLYEKELWILVYKSEAFTKEAEKIFSEQPAT